MGIVRISAFSQAIYLFAFAHKDAVPQDVVIVASPDPGRFVAFRSTGALFIQDAACGFPRRPYF
jgi:hypothetical protein